jgi:LysM repeat protein
VYSSIYPLTRKEAIVTRESKLALIIGFVLVLVVGVLVSDHFSQASSMSLDAQHPEASNMGAVATLGTREKQDLGDSISQAMGDRPMGSTHQPVTIHNGSDRGSILDQAAEEIKQRINTMNLPKAAQITPKPTQTPVMLPKESTDSRVSYRVAAGDTLIAIARRTLGNGDRWQEIHELNADILGPDAILKIGMYLKLPSDAKKGTSSRTRSSQGQTSHANYTVRSGDTLGEISMNLLGTSKRANEIAELNGLESANDIKVGMTLKIPTK